ncbi:hypothetical protein KW797_03655 [Candidatus Parcubacteria bacterium]|nr:hypothetical protein [Candidatus Parcubacteria bacterium]
MPANNTSWIVDYWSGKYGGLGHLFTPARVDTPRPHLPYALDNGIYAAWVKHRPWEIIPFIKHVERYAFAELRPLFVVVPDAVADSHRTIELWERSAEWLRREFRIPLALAVQDGMTRDDVFRLKPFPDWIFVGGTTKWKWSSVEHWTTSFENVHVGRVNSGEKLFLCHSLGVKSVDGSGWFRGRAPQIRELGEFLAHQAVGHPDIEAVARMVRFSRLKGRQAALPLEVA